MFKLNDVLVIIYAIIKAFINQHNRLEVKCLCFLAAIGIINTGLKIKHPN